MTKDRPARTPLHVLAEEGRERWLSGPHMEAVEALEVFRRDHRVSVNMSASALLSFLTTGQRWNVFEWAEREAARTGEPVDDCLRRRLGQYYSLRIGFEQVAGAGMRFHYGAMNLGGMGSPRYGRYCVVDRRQPTETSPDPVWLFEDSLRGERYHSDPKQPSWDRLGEWAATCDLGAELALVKAGAAVGSPTPPPESICNDAEYIEALSCSPLGVEAVQEIRSATDDELQDRALEAALQPPPANEAIDLGLHEEVRALAERKGLAWRPLP